MDYKVRILASGTEAVTRVMVECADGKGNRWSTVGVSPNIVDASFEALTDSISYMLFRDRRLFWGGRGRSARLPASPALLRRLGEELSLSTFSLAKPFLTIACSIASSESK